MDEMNDQSDQDQQEDDNISDDEQAQADLPDMIDMTVPAHPHRFGVGELWLSIINRQRAEVLR